MHFYTADPHFFHQNILKHCARPFRSVAEMNRVILNNYRSTVGPLCQRSCPPLYFSSIS